MTATSTEENMGAFDNKILVGGKCVNLPFITKGLPHYLGLSRVGKLFTY